MAPKSVTFRRHDHLVSVLFGDLLSHSYNITFSMFLYLVTVYILHYIYLCGGLPDKNLIFATRKRVLSMPGAHLSTTSTGPSALRRIIGT